MVGICFLSRIHARTRNRLTDPPRDSLLRYGSRGAPDSTTAAGLFSIRPQPSGNLAQRENLTKDRRRRPSGLCRERSAAEAVERPALALEGVDDVHGGDGLAAGVLRVGDRIAYDVLQEDLEDAPRLLVDEAADALHAPTASKTANRGTLRWRFAPPLPSPLPPFPRPDILLLSFLFSGSLLAAVRSSF
ncbi:unnamed protein product [Spirodela intermedia]|uniref:Uncharacterized protein n=1 Tax=Spirodela intermedia TaxID=51605 RepID=A0A7I8JLH8_SPIIN|nr:unnamed protein product [Spirodela intermedia]CAA6670322.1 unnamed protein product [Spirodela intermedia]